MKKFLCRCNYASLEVYRVTDSFENAREWYLNVYCYGRSLKWIQIFELVLAEDLQ